MFRQVYQPLSGRGTACRRGGFTLLETALATVIVGVGIVSALQLFAVCAKQNSSANQMTTAMMLCDNVREAMAGLVFSDTNPAKTVFSFDGKTFNPPIDSLSAPIGAMSQYTQVVSVVPVYNNKLNSNTNDSALEISKGTYTGAVRVRVRILYQLNPTSVATEVYRCSWVRLDT